MFLDRFNYLPALAVSHRNTCFFKIEEGSSEIEIEVVNSEAATANDLHFAFRSVNQNPINGKFYLASRKLASELKKNVSDQYFTDDQ